MPQGIPGKVLNIFYFCIRRFLFLLFSSFSVSAVQPPQLQVENQSESNPAYVRNKQHPRGWSHPPETHHGQYNDDPQENDFEECPHGLLGPEEQIRPDRIQYQLADKKHQCGFSSGEPLLLPDQPCGDTHQNVKNRPDWSEYSARRIPGRFHQRGVPLTGHEPGSNPACRQRRKHPQYQSQ